MADETIAQSRVCTKCGVSKEFGEFGNHARTVTKRQSVCKICVRTRQEEWIKENVQRNTLNPPSREGTRTCIHCKTMKPRAEFGLRPGYKGGLSAVCDDCERARGRRRYKENTSERIESARWAGFKWRFGLSRLGWESLVKKQNGQCLICEVTMQFGGRRTKTSACVDHDHETKVVRGMLCTRCNQALGLMRESPKILDRAAAYLRGHGK